MSFDCNLSLLIIIKILHQIRYSLSTSPNFFLPFIFLYSSFTSYCSSSHLFLSLSMLMFPSPLLLHFSSPLSPHPESWFVRHCVILGLSRICHTCRDLPIQDGFSGVAWSVLQKRFSLESEQRVLQAYKLEQVNAIIWFLFHVTIHFIASYIISYNLDSLPIKVECSFHFIVINVFHL